MLSKTSETVTGDVRDAEHFMHVSCRPTQPARLALTGFCTPSPDPHTRWVMISSSLQQKMRFDSASDDVKSLMSLVNRKRGDRG